MIVSASKLSRFCGYSRRLNRYPKPKRVQDAADLGTKFHLAVGEWAGHGVTPPDCYEPREVGEWVRALAEQWTPPPSAEFEIVLGLGRDFAYVPTVETADGSHDYEPAYAFTPLLTAGRADCVWQLGSKVYVLDFKTGRSAMPPPGDSPQLISLGLAAAAKYAATSMVLGFYFARDGRFEWTDDECGNVRAIALDSDEAENMRRDVMDMAMLNEEPRPGAWCAGCHEKRRCHFADEATR